MKIELTYSVFISLICHIRIKLSQRWEFIKEKKFQEKQYTKTTPTTKNSNKKKELAFFTEKERIHAIDPKKRQVLKSYFFINSLRGRAKADRRDNSICF